VEAGIEKGKEAFAYCQNKIAELGLEMKLVDAEYGFEGNKILFFFTSDGRVDFRELVKDLAAAFHARIELRQIGVRDEAKMLGGLGVCGKQFCCSQFLGEFHPVSIKMAKIQGLSLNPTKISGTCGRLMCCLKYEECAYEDLVKKAPKVDAFVETPSGKGSVINVNLLRRNAKVRLEDGLDTTLKTFTFDELDILGGKGRRAEYIAAKAEGRLQEAGFTVTPPPSPAPLRSPVSHNVREPRSAAADQIASGAYRQDNRSEQRSVFDQKKKPPAAVSDRPAKSGEKSAKPAPRPQPSDGGPAKKQHIKRYRNGRGKNR
jgi:cell fate regulator YaaT (PSP1 superfamily)